MITTKVQEGSSEVRPLNQLVNKLIKLGLMWLTHLAGLPEHAPMTRL